MPHIDDSEGKEPPEYMQVLATDYRPGRGKQIDRTSQSTRPWLRAPYELKQADVRGICVTDGVDPDTFFNLLFSEVLKADGNPIAEFFNAFAKKD